MKKIIRATGSWQSVVLWGVNASFDEDQQMAFEVLASTYVLTFYNEARGLDEIIVPQWEVQI